MKFKYEGNLSHQQKAVDSIIDIFKNIEQYFDDDIKKIYGNVSNPELIVKNDKFGRQTYEKNIDEIRKRNKLKNEEDVKYDYILDICMETGTGKTYTYTKTIYELNKKYDIYKFIIVVPTIAIKTNTINFLSAEETQQHFYEEYNKKLNLFIVESLKGNKSKEKTIRPLINFIEERYNKNYINILIINSGMLNSIFNPKTKYEHINIFNEIDNIEEGLKIIKPFIIIDEPHKFKEDKTTWKNIQKLQYQYLIRYGATFINYHNLLYFLGPAESFNQNLIKGVIGYSINFSKNKYNEKITLTGIKTKSKEVKFKISKYGEKNKYITVNKEESLEKLHELLSSLSIINMNSNSIELSNGLIINLGETINPYSYHEKLQEIMIEQAINNHFELELELMNERLLNNKPIIKPLSLFFIDLIESYRDKNNNDGYLLKYIKKILKMKIEDILNDKEIKLSKFYRTYLENSLKNIDKVVGGYFSKDNSTKDEAIEEEVNEILRDKYKLLDINNIRRFIFSKWTLKEGWDNPNIFQICKLRTSGSEISKLQEVGRGLRLPVNEYGNRVTNENFYLHYFVDFTEYDFIEQLKSDINRKSGIYEDEIILDKYLFSQFKEVYNIDKYLLLAELDELNYIKKEDIKHNKYYLTIKGSKYLKKKYNKIFNKILDKDKIKRSNDKDKKVKINKSNYKKLKELWEQLNKKNIIEYKIFNEKKYETFIDEFFKKEIFPEINNQKDNNISMLKETIVINNKTNEATTKQETYNTKTKAVVNKVKYNNFIKNLSDKLFINVNTLHNIIKKYINKNNYEKFISNNTLYLIREKYINFLIENVINSASTLISYKEIKTEIKTTELTKNGEVKDELQISKIGMMYEEIENNKLEKYLFEEILAYDSELEKENILKGNEIENVEVFTKIPKNSIKIPIIDGHSYSPDFAFIIKDKDGNKKLYFILETKNIDNKNELRRIEQLKIKLAEKYFNNKIGIKFKKQLSNKKILNLIEEILNEN